MEQYEANSGFEGSDVFSKTCLWKIGGGACTRQGLLSGVEASIFFPGSRENRKNILSFSPFCIKNKPTLPGQCGSKIECQPMN